ncbi:MAG: alkaline phosphatase family protein [Acidobacteriota bacterium]
MTESFLPQVQNIVFLMLENRSLDNLLGWLYTKSPGWNPPPLPLNVYPKGSSAKYDGLTAGMYSNPDPDTGNPVTVIPVSDSNWQSGYAIPYRDPYEALKAYPSDIRAPNGWNGVMNQLFGNQNIITGLPSKSDGAPQMKGFLQDYKSWDDGSWQGQDILWTYTPTQANIINSIALQYGVSDRWFCSAPTETTPNRAYSLCGTSLGHESDAASTYNHTTIFNAIAANKSWGLYAYDRNYGGSGKTYTEGAFPLISKARNGEIGSIMKFSDRARAGTLPAFTYLEPNWTDWDTTGNDYHPNSIIPPGEQFLSNVYQAVRYGKQWDHTLLIITFDEHGGTYDHVQPPWGSLNPDGLNGDETGFKFDLFGARVPTILVSPFVPPSTVFRAPQENIKNQKYPFDHTSFIKTLLKWAGVYDAKAPSFGKRMLAAPTFESVLANHSVNDGNVNFIKEQTMAPTAFAPPNLLHPAGPPEVLRPLLKGIPIRLARKILATCKTLDEVKAEVERYRKDPKRRP